MKLDVDVDQDRDAGVAVAAYMRVNMYIYVYVCICIHVVPSACYGYIYMQGIYMCMPLCMAIFQGPIIHTLTFLVFNFSAYMFPLLCLYPSSKSYPFPPP